MDRFHHHAPDHRTDWRVHRVDGSMKLSAFCLSLFLISSNALASDIVGRASVVDGDTIDIQGQRIRFNGIDAPESRQKCLDAQSKVYRCGKVSADMLDTFLSLSRPTRCQLLSRDRYQRIVADCFRSDGASVASWMTRNGYALDWPKYSKGAYAADQAEAKSGHLGLWSGTFDLPWEWRKP